ncbi:MAG: epoxyqueuosine reductase QueH, partial [Aquificae bacterium]|nr:epoxyqueuosine reductase QueH [Aquificota bacterium]
MKKLLVHICCGVDAVYSLRKLKQDFPDAHIEGYFYDPNIHPEGEYILRWLETERVCRQLGIKCHPAPYQPELWLEAVKGLENEPERGKRCSVCHDLRLEETARFCRENGFDSFTTVLMMSPKKDFQVLKEIGEDVARRYG